jgi:hypothetical protein
MKVNAMEGNGKKGNGMKFRRWQLEHKVSATRQDE